MKGWLQMKETVTYLIKVKGGPFDLYLTNKPMAPEDAIYTRNRSRARDFNGLEDASINMTEHTAIKKVVTEQTKYKEIEYD